MDTNQLAVIYARYSSEGQREASIEDQVRNCRRLCEERGWSVLKVYEDRAISGATWLRPGYQEMLADARAKKFNIIVAEALDRLSRDQAETATLYKRMQFGQIRIVTRADGEVAEIHVGLKGTMNALFLKDLAMKTHRGLEGLVLQGKNPGGKAYGYRVIRSAPSPNGEIERGGLEIVPAEAEIVRRIFKEFAAGASPRTIARRLNADGIPGPRKAWRDGTIRGHDTRGTGILRNTLYVGRRRWNKQEYLHDPETGRRVARLRAPEDEVSADVPDLRIVDQADWDAVQARLDASREAPRSQKQRQTKFWEHRRPKHLFTGLIFCGTCGGVMENTGQDYMTCRAARSGAGCNNRKSVRRSRIEQVVLDGLKSRLMKPEMVQAFIRGFTARINQERATAELTKSSAQSELARVTKRLQGLYDAIADGLRTPGLRDQLLDLETKQTELQRQIEDAPAPEPRLHPGLADRYRDMVADLQASLADPAGRVQAAHIIRGLVERITVRQDKAGQLIELTGNILKLLTLAGGGVPAPYQSSVKVVAGAGFEPTTFRL